MSSGITTGYVSQQFPVASPTSKPSIFEQFIGYVSSSRISTTIETPKPTNISSDTIFNPSKTTVPRLVKDDTLKANGTQDYCEFDFECLSNNCVAFPDGIKHCMSPGITSGYVSQQFPVSPVTTNITNPVTEQLPSVVKNDVATVDPKPPNITVRELTKADNAFEPIPAPLQPQLTMTQKIQNFVSQINFNKLNELGTPNGIGGNTQIINSNNNMGENPIIVFPKPSIFQQIVNYVSNSRISTTIPDGKATETTVDTADTAYNFISNIFKNITGYATNLLGSINTGSTTSTTATSGTVGSVSKFGEVIDQKTIEQATGVSQPTDIEQSQNTQNQTQTIKESKFYTQNESDLKNETIQTTDGPRPFGSIGCGPTAVSNIINQYGIANPSPLDIANQLGVIDWGYNGTNLFQDSTLINVLRSYGVGTNIYNKSFYNLQEYVQPNTLIFIAGNYSGNINHIAYLEYTGDPNNIILKDNLFVKNATCKVVGDEKLSCTNTQGQSVNINLENYPVYTLTPPATVSNSLNLQTQANKQNVQDVTTNNIDPSKPITFANVGDGGISLPANFVPPDLVSINGIKNTIESKNIYLNRDATVALINFAKYAESQGYTLYVSDGYRSYEEQLTLHNENPTGSATPGNSEHQTGLAIDIYYLDGDSIPQALPGRLINKAVEFGIAHPIVDDPAHFFVIAGLGIDTSGFNLVAKTDEDYLLLNEAIKNAQTNTKP